MKWDRIQLAHGSGGKLSQELTEQIMLPAFNNQILAELHDGAALQIDGARLAFSTDSYVVKPLFFPGGDIGKLAVCGTVNDLAMTGAVPLYLSAGFIIEEGFSCADLVKIVASMRSAAAEAGVQIVTGDTKVVEKGAADGIYINTAGIGRVLPGITISARQLMPAQDVIISGSLGEHAVTVMGGRYGLTLPEGLSSDCAPLNKMVQEIITAYPEICVMRDLTRGGLAAALNEIAAMSGLGILLEEELLPIRREVAAVCDMLGYDPLYLANEGKLVLFADPAASADIVAMMQRHPYGRDARVIGRTAAQPAGKVGMQTMIGGVRLIDMPLGELVPRIC